VSVTTIEPYGQEHAGDTALWTTAALVVAALHVGLVAAYLVFRPAPVDRAEAPVIDVAFMPAINAPASAAPEAQPAEPVPPVQQSVAEPEPPQEMTEPAQQPEPVPPPVALTTPLPEPIRPEEPALTVPPPKSAEPPPQARKPETAPERPAHKRAVDDKADKEKRQAAAPPKPAAAQASRPSRMAAAPNSGADSEGATAGRASWESELAAHIRRYATYSANGSREAGTVRVGVTIDRNGRLLSRRLAGSSGSSTLDSAAMAVIERAQPYPRFPAGMSQAQIALTIPLHLRPQ
jgi:periplasmic protein TonB